MLHYLLSLPLLLIPFTLYHIFYALFGFTLDHKFVWILTGGDALVALSIILLYVEIFKSTHTLFMVAFAEMMLWEKAYTSQFFLIMMTMLVDVIGGFTVTIRGARRDFGGRDDANHIL
jgi:hypothetical protein